MKSLVFKIFAVILTVYFSFKIINVDDSYNDVDKAYNWNESDDISYSSREIKSLFEQYTYNKNEFLVLYYDGGRCNSDLEIILDAIVSLKKNIRIMLIVNLPQSRVDEDFVNFKDNLFIVGDEHKYFKEYLGLESEKPRKFLLYIKGEKIIDRDMDLRSKQNFTNELKKVLNY